jgi:surface protein
MNKYFLLPLILLLFLGSCETEEQSPDKPQIIKKEKISGFVQKGPFVSGTSILMNELNSQMVQTGKVFTSTIINDMGLFELNSVELNSSFVEFTSSGFYFNEVSGEISNSQITLTNLSDIEDRNSININVLTHLEKRRVETLMKEGKSFSESKKQSRDELLSVFSMSLNNDSSFEEFDISKNTEEGGILLGISIILQGNRSVGQLTELLSRIQNDFGNNGKLDDENILNSLRTSTLSLDFTQIRENIEKRFKELNNNSPVPDFEKQLKKFLSYRDYPLTITIDGEGTVEERIVSNPSGREYPYSTVVELTPVPKEGWVFESWGGDLSGNEVPNRITVDGDKSVTVKFKRRDYPLNLTIEGEGTVEERIVTDPNGRQYPFQTVVELTPVPKEGWEFDSWDGDLTGTETPQTITVDKEKNVTVKFKRKDYKINFTIIGEGTVEEKIVSNPSGRVYPFQTVVELTPVPKEGWVFESWSGDLTGTDSPINLTLDKDRNVTVVFRQPIFRLGDNGVTCICENVKVGEKGFINGVEFEVVDNSLLRKRRNEKVDMTKLCTSLVTDMSEMFGGTGTSQNRNTFNQPIGNWDVSNVTNMSEMFTLNLRFNQSLEFWDVSKVTDMGYMFAISPFNQPIGNWNVSNVKTMGYMFQGSPFNQPIGNWDVSKVTIMSQMFFESKFDQPIGNWNVSNVTDMYGMFMVSPFNQPIGNWDVSNVTDMSWMFYDSKFDQPITNWNVSNVLNMSRMFRNSQFNQPIENWDVSNVMDMSWMFTNSKLDQPIGNWDVSNVTDMSYMFYQSPFNQPIGNWDVSNVINMGRMFGESQFNQPIGNWDVSNVFNMEEMFYQSQFNQNISKWCVSNIPSEPDLFSQNSPLTSQNKPVWGTCPD